MPQSKPTGCGKELHRLLNTLPPSLGSPQSPLLSARMSTWGGTATRSKNGPRTLQPSPYSVFP